MTVDVVFVIVTVRFATVTVTVWLTVTLATVCVTVTVTLPIAPALTGIVWLLEKDDVVVDTIVVTVAREAFGLAVLGFIT